MNACFDTDRLLMQGVATSKTSSFASHFSGCYFFTLWMSRFAEG